MPGVSLRYALVVRKRLLCCGRKLGSEMTREQRIKRFDAAAKKLREAFVRSLDQDAARGSSKALNDR